MKLVSIYINGTFWRSKEVGDKVPYVAIEASLPVPDDVLCIGTAIEWEFKTFTQEITEHPGLRNVPYSPRTPIYMTCGCYYRAYFVSDELEIIKGNISLKS